MIYKRWTIFKADSNAKLIGQMQNSGFKILSCDEWIDHRQLLFN
jgi:hypothetical protein